MFSAVVRTGSITGGAAAVHLAIGSASERVKRMEEAFGSALFIRLKRGVSLTAAGHVVLRHAQIMLSTADALETELDNLRKGVTGRIRIAANSVAMARSMRKPLSEFLKNNPGTSVSLDEVSSPAARDLLLANRIDLAVGAIQNTPGLEIQPLYEDRLVAVVSASSMLSSRQSVSFEELLGGQLLMLSSRSALHSYLVAKAKGIGRILNSRVNADDLETLCEMAQANLGVGIAPQGTVAQRCATMRVKLVPIQDDWALRHIGVMWQTGSPLSLASARLLACLIEAAQSGP